MDASTVEARAFCQRHVQWQKELERKEEQEKAVEPKVPQQGLRQELWQDGQRQQPLVHWDEDPGPSTRDSITLLRHHRFRDMVKIDAKWVGNGRGCHQGSSRWRAGCAPEAALTSKVAAGHKEHNSHTSFSATSFWFRLKTIESWDIAGAFLKGFDFKAVQKALGIGSSISDPGSGDISTPGCVASSSSNQCRI